VAVLIFVAEHGGDVEVRVLPSFATLRAPVHKDGEDDVGALVALRVALLAVILVGGDEDDQQGAFAVEAAVTQPLLREAPKV
jgi:hypothetical protein